MKKIFKFLFGFIGILICVGGVISPLVFLLPKGNNVEIKLDRPNTPRLVEDVNGDLVLEIDENSQAFEYRFYLKEGKTQGVGEGDYTVFKTTKQPKVNLTEENIIKRNTTYYFKGQYVGKNGYVDSEVSNEIHIENISQVEIPTNAKVDTKLKRLTWDNMLNATGYDVYGENGIFYTENNYMDLEAQGYNKPGVTYKFKVKARGGNNFLSSPTTKEIEYSIEHNLKTPTNIKVIGDGMTRKITWDEVPYAGYYELKITREFVSSSSANNTVSKTEKVYHNTYLFNQFVEGSDLMVGKYSFTVRACSDNPLIHSSDFSKDVSQQISKKLGMPTNIRIMNDGNDKKIISWNKVPNALAYDIILNYESNKMGVVEELTEKIAENIRSNGFTLIIPDYDFLRDLKEFSIQICAKGDGVYYLNSSLSPKVSTKTNIIKFTKEQYNLRIEFLGGEECLVWDHFNPKILRYEVYDNNISIGSAFYESEVSTNKIIFPLTNYVKTAGMHALRVKIMEYDGVFVAEMSEYVTKEVIVQLKAPSEVVASIQDDYITVNITAVANADYYVLKVGDKTIRNNIRTTSVNIPFGDIQDFLIDSGISFNVEAHSDSKYFEASEGRTSNRLIFAGQVREIICQRIVDRIYVDFKKIVGVETYNIKVNGQEVKFSQLTGIESIKKNGRAYYFDLKDFSLENESLITVNITPVIETGVTIKPLDVNPEVVEKLPAISEITMQGYVVKWNRIFGASSYSVFLNGKEYEAYDNLSLDISSYISDADIYAINVLAYSYDKQKVKGQRANQIMYNTENINTEYTRRYFFINNTWFDYHIENQNELNHFVLYCANSFITNPEAIYFGFDYGADVADEIAKAFTPCGQKTGVTDSHGNAYDGEYIGGTISYGARWGNPSPNAYNIIFEFNGMPSEQTPSYIKVNVVQQENPDVEYNKMVSTPEREKEYNSFKTETSMWSVPVKSSNYLSYVLSAGGHPVFENNEDGAYLNGLYEKMKNILRQINSDEMTDFQKVRHIYEYIIENVDYDYGIVAQSNINSANYYSFYLDGALEYKLGVCDSRAKLFTSLCGMEGIESYYVSGWARSGGSMGGHAWNKVHISLTPEGKKEWFLVDTTWGDAATKYRNDETYYEKLNYNYFLTNDEKVKESHFEAHTSAFHYPVASGEYTYSRV